MGRQVPLKKTGIIIEACKELKVPLIVIGNGPEHSNLVNDTGPTIHFKTEITDKEMPDELASAEAFLFASFEDFGIAPIEAMATGTPVIAYKAGGAMDYVVPGKTGEFFEVQTVESLVAALKDFKPSSYNHESIQKHVTKFSDVEFRKHIAKFLESKLR